MGISYLLDLRTDGDEGFIGNDKANSFESLLNDYRVTVTDGITNEERDKEEENSFKTELNGYMATIVSQNSQNI